ncbi:MAG: efflux RND transporter periplasmic adaptor subunit [Myxococcales bacterium]|nr:MAG: efflux RND transporter periplasmic adaptor subunit [Myxococcales bacterium]
MLFLNRLPWVLILIVSLATAACSKPPQAQAVADPQQKPLEVEAAAVVREAIETRIDVTGTLAAWEESVLAIEVEGRIGQVLADLGDRVRKGSVLLRISSEEYELKATQANVELSSAQADFDRAQKLVAQGFSSQQEIDDVTRRLDLAVATLKLAKKKLDDTSLRAPFDGVIAERMVSPGEYARSGSACFRLAQDVPLKFKADVPERHSLDVHAGDPIQAFPAPLAGKPLAGKVTRVGPSVAQQNRSFVIEAQVENPDGAAKPGTFARATLLTAQTEEVLTIPETAVIEFAGNPRVFVVEDGKARERVIETGGKRLDRVIVTKGLKEGEKVVSSGVDLLVDQQPISVR